MKPRRLPLTLALMLSLATCAAKRTDLNPPSLVARAEQQGQSDRAAAIAALEGYLAGNPDPAIAPWAMVYAGEEHRLNGDNAGARPWFEKAADRYPTHPLKQSAVLGMALVDAASSLSGNTAATLALVPESGVLPTMNADRYRLLARLANDDGEPYAKVSEDVQKALRYAEADPAVQARVSKALADLAQDPASAPSASADDPAAALNAVRGALRRKDFASVSQRVADLTARWPDSPEAKTAAYLGKRAAAGDPATANRVGVLLPLSGEYSPPGISVKEAITLANQREGSPLELVFYDTQGSADKAVAGLDQLVLQKGCMAVMGPLLRPEVEAVSAAAQGYGEPLIVLSQYMDAGSTEDYVYGAFLTVQQQSDALVKHAFDVRGIEKFAILYPKNAYGESAAAAFTASVKSHGGTVTDSLPYEPDAHDFLDVARTLGHKANRSGELYRLRREAEAKGQDPSKITVPPAYEFQAVFIPDNARRSSLVASALAYEEFPVGTFRPRSGEQPVVLLGLNGWNSPDLLEGGKYLREALFVDAFLPTDPSVETFVRSFQQELGRTPIVVDAMAYDAARLVIQATRKAGVDRVTLRRDLTDARIDSPVARGDHFGPDRALARDLYVLTLSSQGITLADAAANPETP